MNILIFGAGSYVFGGADSDGTIFPALCTYSAEAGQSLTVSVVSTNSALYPQLSEKASELIKATSSSINISFHGIGNSDSILKSFLDSSSF